MIGQCISYGRLLEASKGLNWMWCCSMHSGGYLLTNTYPPCNGGSHRRCCRNETSRTFQPAFFSCGEISQVGNPKKRADESNKENFGNLKKNRHILRKKR